MTAVDGCMETMTSPRRRFASSCCSLTLFKTSKPRRRATRTPVAPSCCCSVAASVCFSPVIWGSTVGGRSESSAQSRSNATCSPCRTTAGKSFAMPTKAKVAMTCMRQSGRNTTGSIARWSVRDLPLSRWEPRIRSLTSIRFRRTLVPSAMRACGSLARN